MFTFLTLSSEIVTHFPLQVIKFDTYLKAAFVTHICIGRAVLVYVSK